MAQMRIVERRYLYAVIVDQLCVCVVEPAIFEGLAMEERAGIRRGEGNLDRMRIDLRGEADGLLDGFLGFTRKAEDEGAVNGDSKLVTVLGEPAGHVDAHALLDVVQDLLIAGFVA